MGNAKATSAGVGTLSPGQRPWPHLTSADGHPNCWHCSWVWYEPAGRMVIKFLNAMCPVRGHRPVSD